MRTEEFYNRIARQTRGVIQLADDETSKAFKRELEKEMTARGVQIKMAHTDRASRSFEYFIIGGNS